MAEITFIIPNRGGEHIDYVIKKMKEFYPDEKYLVITEYDDEDFKKGQLFNIAYNYVDTGYMCLLDNDMFFSEKIDLIGEYNKCDKLVLQPFNKISQVTLRDNGGFYVTHTDTLNYLEFNGKIDKTYGFAPGGCIFLHKKIFEIFGGYSNLYTGWGGEDNDFFLRSNKSFTLIKKNIFHITHKKRSNPENTKAYQRLLSTFKTRKSELDGYKHTTYDLVQDSNDNNIRYIYVNNISVILNFAYRKLMKKQPMVNNKSLNLPFDEVYILHLAADKDREELINPELERLGIKDKVKWFNGVHIPFEQQIMEHINQNKQPAMKRVPLFNCVLNHYMLIKQAYERGINTMLVIEDDMVFNSDIALLNKYFYKYNFPVDWNILRWDVTYFDRLTDQNIVKGNEYFNKFVKGSGCNFGSCGCYALNRTGMKLYIDYIDKNGYVPADWLFMNPDATHNHYIANTKFICEGRSANYNHTGLQNKMVKSHCA